MKWIGMVIFLMLVVSPAVAVGHPPLPPVEVEPGIYVAVHIEPSEDRPDVIIRTTDIITIDSLTSRFIAIWPRWQKVKSSVSSKWWMGLYGESLYVGACWYRPMLLEWSGPGVTRQRYLRLFIPIGGEFIEGSLIINEVQQPDPLIRGNAGWGGWYSLTLQLPPAQPHWTNIPQAVVRVRDEIRLIVR